MLALGDHQRHARGGRASGRLVRPYRFAPDHFEQQGWEGQLRRVERWHERTSRALDPYGGVAVDEAIDFLYAFFQAAYHMRDWLQNSGAASRTSLDALMSTNHCLKLCRDLCNGSKHFVLDSRRSKTNHIGLMREYVPPPVGQSEGASSRLRLLAFESHEGEVEFAYIDELMADCVAAWQEFCVTLPSGDESSSCS
jgi:hypothetical protein